MCFSPAAMQQTTSPKFGALAPKLGSSEPNLGSLAPNLGEAEGA